MLSEMLFPNSTGEPSAESATALVFSIIKNPFALEKLDMTLRQHEKQTDCKT